MAHCVGRERELAFITSRLESTGANGTGLVVVSGPAGIGKSTLVAELRERARLGGFAVLEGYCVRHSAFAPWATIAAAALAFLRARGEHEQLAPGDVDALAPLVSGRAPREREEDDEGALHFAGALSRLLAAVGRVRPVLVLLRGYSQVDESSRALLRTLLDSAGPSGEPTPGAPAALVVCAVRPEEAGDLAEHPRASIVNLEGLDIEGVKRLVNEEPYLQRLHAATGGAPDAILALLDRPASSRAAESPSRVAQLGPTQQALLVALAAAGRPLPVHVLATASGIDPSATGRAVPGLVDARMLWRDLDATVGDVVLGLELRDDGNAALAQMTLEDRAALEQRLGEALLEWGKVPAEEWLGHLLRGRAPRAAVGRAADVALTLLRRHAPATAMRVVIEAAAHADRDALAKLAPIAAQAARGASAHSEARAIVDRARAHAAEDPTLARIAAELALAVGDLDACDAALRDARTHGAQRSDDERGAIEAVSAEFSFQRGNLDEAERFARAACEHAREEAPVHTQARNTLTKVYLWRGELDRAWDWTQEHIARARTRGATSEVLRGVINLGVIAVRRGDLDDAARHFEAARAIAARGGTMMMRGVLKENEAVLAHLRGRFGDALALYQEALGVLIRVGHRQFLARVANNLGELYVQVGETGRARRLCDYAAQVGRGLARGLVAEGLLLRGQVDLADGHVDAARSALQEALSMFTASGEFARGSEAHLLLSRAALVEGDVAKAQRELESIADDEEKSGLRVVAERTLVATEIARAEGRDATSIADRALDLCERTGDADLELKAHVLCGLCALDQGELDVARTHAREAEQRRSELVARVGEALRVSYDATLSKTGLQKLASRLDLAAAEAKALRAPATSERTTSGSGVERGGLVGESAAMNSLRRLIARVGPADTTVLLRGETGTGKERVAEAIHRASRRRSGPMIKVNCAAIGEGVLLSELFGHERGAYTGAHGRRKGRFEAADGGTIFLDEIGDISPAMQSALLRVLQEHTFERVGGNTPIRVDVRVIAATNKNLEDAMRAGAFREDLYYRLADITVKIPPLRDRLEDVPLLASHFLESEAQQGGLEHKRLSTAALRKLCEYNWPGNVRELVSKIRNAMVMSEGDEIQPDEIDVPVMDQRPYERTSSPSLVPPAGDRSEVDVVYERIRGGGVPLFEMRKELEKGCIQRALGEAGGNITRAATLLGMKRPRLSQLVREYGLAKGTDPGDTSES
ncbi:MAG: sigma 54-interacting transcriptional regulator [Myxococcales bacterium]|nr:sigma 54-interacting transcriptional regulator [Myxococcales bacterium]